ncbi:MAG: tetratricopeptide repeat protein [Burkholderiaceae bacterium]
MRSWPILVCALLAACASPSQQRVPPPDFLFKDEIFAAPSERIAAADVFALSDQMKVYLRTEIASQLRQAGSPQGLINALYERDQLKLQYDASMTRNAAQAFDARAGNCLSLVVMTAAFAKQLGLPVTYQSAYLEETWGRSGDLLVRSGHVNLTLDRKLADRNTIAASSAMTIDFLPAESLRGLRSRVIAEETIVAMYMNNKAVEALVEGRLDDAYAWAREAILQSPEYLGAHNTLGVLYMRRGDLAQSAKVFNYLLEREPANARAISNLAQVFTRQGRDAESAALLRRLAEIEPVAPFHYFNRGLEAMQEQKFKLARDLFAKEVARADYQAEFHFWLALANFKLGDIEPARKHLTLAMENGATRNERALYAAKLAWLKTHQLQ